MGIQLVGLVHSVSGPFCLVTNPFPKGTNNVIYILYMDILLKGIPPPMCASLLAFIDPDPALQRMYLRSLVKFPHALPNSHI